MHLLLSTMLYVSIAFGPVRAASLGSDGDVRSWRLDDLAMRIRSMPDGASRSYFMGVLMTRQAHPSEAIAALNLALPTLRQKGGASLAEALYDLTYDEVLVGRYAEASKAADELSSRGLSLLDPAKQQDFKDDTQVWHALAGSPPMTIEHHGPIQLPITRMVTGQDTIPIDVNGVPLAWIVDTGANLSVLAESTARKLGVTLLPGSARTRGSTGAENVLRVGVIEEMRMGPAVVRHVPVLVLDDQSLIVQTSERRGDPNGRPRLPGAACPPERATLVDERVSRRSGSSRHASWRGAAGACWTDADNAGELPETSDCSRDRHGRNFDHHDFAI
ncbi:MAG: retropepsin-like aspartic protease [Janthinobacterium lividum]